MTRTTARSRRTAATVGALTAGALLLASAGPATAATVRQDVKGETAAQALLLILNLPGGSATRVIVSIDPVDGSISKTTTTTAAANATVVRGVLGTQSLGLGASSAKLPSPTEASNNPAGAIESGLAGTPLANLLKAELLPSKAKVTTAPTSSSEAAVANLGVGLPDALAGALAPLTGPLLSTVDGALKALAAASGTPVAQICAGATTAVTALKPATTALDGVLAALPIPVPVTEVLNTTALGALCGLSETLTKLNTALQAALKSLTGPSGVVGAGLISANQSITRNGTTVTARSEAEVAGLTLLGQKPFASADVLRTVSTASTNGLPGSAKATIESSIANLTGGSIDPFLQVRTTIAGIRDSFVGGGALPAELKTVFDDLFGLLNGALAPVGITLFKLDDSVDSKKISACPGALSGVLTGTLTQSTGRCAAAATRGVGLSVSLPAALTGPLMIGGPLVSLQIVPTAAVAQAQNVTLTTPPPATPEQLPRTGLGAGLASFALLLLLAGAVIRRRAA